VFLQFTKLFRIAFSRGDKIVNYDNEFVKMPALDEDLRDEIKIKQGFIAFDSHKRPDR